MDKITQTERYRQSLVLYAFKYGVTKAAVRYHTDRQYVYRWMKRYDGTLASVRDRSRRQHHHANEHTTKVERSHRKDNEYFYALHKFYSFGDLVKQMAVYNRKYNNFPMRLLKWKSPREVLKLAGS